MTSPTPTGGATPGPWRVEEQMNSDDGEGFGIHSADDWIVADVHADIKNGDAVEALANARLIAAAPDLLAALQASQSSLDELLDYSGGADNALADPYVVERAQVALSAARAALASALGLPSAVRTAGAPADGEGRHG